MPGSGERWIPVSLPPHYRAEKIVETYYAISLAEWMKLTFDYQFIANPAYNADRGPVSFLAGRLHAEF